MQANLAGLEENACPPTETILKEKKKKKRGPVNLLGVAK